MIRENGIVMMSEEEYMELKKSSDRDWEKEYKELLNFLPKIVARKKHTTDIQLSRKDFIKLWDYGVEQMDLVTESFSEENNLVYGNDMEMHWMGYFCNCFDGATVQNHIIPAIQSVDDELDGYEYTMEEK